MSTALTDGASANDSALTNDGASTDGSPAKIDGPGWQRDVFEVLKQGGVSQIAYVPDAGHSYAIRAAIADPDITDVVLTTEEEGVGVTAGAWLGGVRSALLMQSSGVGNCLNM